MSKAAASQRQPFPISTLKPRKTTTFFRPPTTMLRRSSAPETSPHHRWNPHSPAPSPYSTWLPSMEILSSSSTSADSSSRQSSVDVSPPLIAMAVIAVIAFIAIIFSRPISRQFLRFYRRYRQRRRRSVPSSSSAGDVLSLPYSFDSPRDANFYVVSPEGLQESLIKTIPLSIYTRKSGFHDCAVCLLEFREDDYVRTLPACSHAFHVDCIDVWLRSHANCPLCRAGIFRQDSPFRPVMAARIRPDLDDLIFPSIILQPLPEIPTESEEAAAAEGEITQERSPIHERINNQSEDRFNGRNFLLKRSYSFEFERNIGSDNLVTEPSTASPWRFRRGGGGFWSKRPSPFSSLSKARVFSFHHYRGMKSPFSRRRSFLPLSESSVRTSGGGSSRRRKSLASPMFVRTSAAATGFALSSRLRSGDPEALLSPERFNRR
ncbi:RING-H2 finger protein ATL65-like [Henckelia pumila]|uniref:RING-H2 finger protein ATL65-like n=1 Tax=Henckelia pumila TaxID=405737 RepID=UPI003C6DF653